MIHGIVSVLLIILVFILYFELKKIFLRKKLQHFEAPPNQLPILGVAGRFWTKPNDQIINTVFELFEEVETTPIQVWIGPILTIGVSEPQDIQVILTSEHCLDKPYFYDQFHCNTSLIATKKETWKPDRRALNTTFNINTLQSYIPLLNEKSRILLEKTAAHEQEPGDLYQTVFICMMDMVMRTTMGTEMNLQSERGEFYYDIAKKIMNNIQYRIVRIWLKWDFTYWLTNVGRIDRILVKFCNNIFDIIFDLKVNQLNLLMSQGINHLENAKNSNAINFLEKCILMEREGIFNHQKVRDQLQLILVAGIDTSSITVFGTLLMLAINQKHQKLVVDELRSIFETADCDVTQEHISKMKYTERVIKEVLRLIPPVPFIARKATADIEVPKGTIPNGAMILINIMLLHRNPKIWGKNVLEFDPDRFLPENVAKRPPYSYIPFSGGPRSCIGMRYAMISAKITLAHLLRRYKFTSDLRFQDIRLNTHLVTEVINEKPLRIEQRDF